MKLMTSNRIRRFFYLVFFYNVVSLVLGVLQFETGINPNIVANYFRIFIGLVIIAMFIGNFKKIRYSYLEVFTILYPVISIILGIVYNGINVDIAKDTFTVFSFWLLFKLSGIISFDNKEFEIFLEKISKYYYYIMMIVIFLALLVFPCLGLSSGAVGILSISFLIPLSFDIARGSRRFIFSFILIILGQKRGVVLGGVSELLSTLFYNFKMNKVIKRIISLLSICMAVTLLFVVFGSRHYTEYPRVIQPSIYKFQQLNFFDENKRTSLYRDARIIEIRNSMKPLLENKALLLTGVGHGYLYDYDYTDDIEKKHNVHFSPVNILTRYGLFYFLSFYYLVIRALIRNRRLLKKGDGTLIQKFFLLYFIGGLINSFTAFTLFSDFWWIVAFGYLTKLINTRRKSNEIINLS